MSWESSSHYYRIINETVRNRLGGVHSARILLCSVDFAEIERLQHSGQWDQLGEILVERAKGLERGGAAFFLICTIILGCTEIMMLVVESDSPVPLFDTTRIHATTAVDYALAAPNEAGSLSWSR